MQQLILKPNNVPTEPGWYWHKLDEYQEVIEVRDFAGRLGVDWSPIRFLEHFCDDSLFSDRLPEPIELPPKPRVGVLPFAESDRRYVVETECGKLLVAYGPPLDNDKGVIWYD